MYWNDASWWMWIPMSLMMIVVWGLVVWGAVQLFGTRRPSEPRTPTATEILDERLATGEIDAEEYRELRATLEGRPKERTPSPG